MLHKHPDLLSDDDLRAWIAHLVDDQVEESPRLDYKEIQRLDRPRDRREVAKDVSSFANEVGGTILYGVPEDRTADGPPIPCKPYGVKAIPSFEGRVEDILVESIQPTLPEHKVRAVEVSRRPKKVVYLVWVPESWAGVHMVEGYRESRYYRRGNYRAVMMAEREVRERYERILRVRDWVDDFLGSAELNYIARRLPVAYRSHYVVCPAILSENRVDFASPAVRDWLNSNRYAGSPYRPSPYGVRTKLDVRQDTSKWYPYTEIYRNGAISHWTPASVSPRKVGIHTVEALHAYPGELNAVQEFLTYAGQLYSFIRYAGPIRVLVEVFHHSPIHMDTLKLAHPPQDPNSWPELLSHAPVLSLDIEESAMLLINEPNRVLKSLADEMFRHFGFEGAPCFDEDLNLIHVR